MDCCQLGCRPLCQKKVLPGFQVQIEDHSDRIICQYKIWAGAGPPKFEMVCRHKPKRGPDSKTKNQSGFYRSQPMEPAISIGLGNIKIRRDISGPGHKLPPHIKSAKKCPLKKSWRNAAISSPYSLKDLSCLSSIMPKSRGFSEQEKLRTLYQMGVSQNLQSPLHHRGRGFRMRFRDLCVGTGFFAKVSAGGWTPEVQQAVRRKLVYENTDEVAGKGFLPWLEKNL
ncbi:hypothetical protein GWK47_019850 [Chionoecetes opilio]|uniref:Uncharacterized protein n=1 Tax=Chionoecetes opilio TaxID=41210 RepID=A0A8J4XU63_CHIOP|nr:hypothetical protein GWK47_019850 [Chionoecetes opilio]